MTSPATSKKKWTAADVRESLSRRWKPEGHLIINEAPMGSDRSGSRIDMLVIGLWSSRGHEIEAVEIKVSVSDWRRELAAPAKADFWVRHSDLFWVAAPADVAAKIKDEIPSGWGLIAVGEKTNRVIVKPSKNRDRTPLPWKTTIGVLRAGADAGMNALHQARLSGARTGREEGIAEARRKGLTDITDSEMARLRRAAAERDRLVAMISTFEQHSGLNLADETAWGVCNLGYLTALANEMSDQGSQPSSLAHGIPRHLERLRSDVADLARIVEAIGEQQAKAGADGDRPLDR